MCPFSFDIGKMNQPLKAISGIKKKNTLEAASVSASVLAVAEQVLHLVLDYWDLLE